MPKLKTTIIFLAVFGLLTPHASFAAVDLPYSSTFNCPEWSQEDPGQAIHYYCDGLDYNNSNGSWYALPSGRATQGSTTSVVDTSIDFFSKGIKEGDQIYLQNITGYPQVTISSITTTINPSDTLNFYPPVATPVSAGFTYSIFNYKIWSTLYYSGPVGSAGRSQITTEANNPIGDGGRGRRMWIGNGNNVDSGALAPYEFNSAIPELWVRWYMRYPLGFSWDTLLYHKLLYMRAVSPNAAQIIPEFYGIDQISIAAQGAVPANHPATCNGCGWKTIMGGLTSDGKWHYYEVHVKWDTDGTNGIGEFWVDGKQVINKTNVNWGTQSGFSYFSLISNQAFPHNDFFGSYVDVDDVAISAAGRIGPIAASFDTTPPSPPTGVNIN